MADNLEVKIEQLTDAIRSLYQRPALSQSEINNLMTSLAQKFENSSDTATQRFIGVIVNETKKVLEEKQIEMRQQLTGFENLMKQMTQGIANSKMPMEVTKILNEVTDMYAKLGSQEIALQKINQTLIANKTANPINEIIKLSNEFAVFSRGFENITHTLNKNFSDFRGTLCPAKSFDPQDGHRTRSREVVILLTMYLAMLSTEEDRKRFAVLYEAYGGQYGGSGQCGHLHGHHPRHQLQGHEHPYVGGRGSRRLLPASGCHGPGYAGAYRGACGALNQQRKGRRAELPSGAPFIKAKGLRHCRRP